MNYFASDSLTISGSQFHLIQGGTPSPRILPVSAGLSAWTGSKDSWNQLPGSDPAASAVFLEPVKHDDRLLLLLIDRGGHDIRVNDQRVPGITLLAPGDQVRIDFGDPMEIARYQRVYIGKPAPDHIGLHCPVCLDAFHGDTRIYQCPNCPQVLHLEEDGEAPLQCALTASECPRCTAPIRQTDGYAVEPEFLKS